MFCIIALTLFLCRGVNLTPPPGGKSLIKFYPYIYVPWRSMTFSKTLKYMFLENLGFLARLYQFWQKSEHEISIFLLNKEILHF